MNTALCILFTLLLGLIFRWAALLKLPMLPIVVINYLICSIIGWVYAPVQMQNLTKEPWITHSILLGILFFTGFSLFAFAVQKAGLPLAVLFQKLSLILSVPFAVLLGDRLSLIQYLGISLACVAIFTLNKEQNHIKKERTKFYGPLMGCLLVAAAIECTFILVKSKMHWEHLIPIHFISLLFMVAFMNGTLYILFFKRDNLQLINGKVLTIGLLLGFPNFYSIYFMLKALHSEIVPSLFFTLLNILIIILSCITGYLLFKDKLTKNQLIGLGMSIVAIALLTLSN